MTNIKGDSFVKKILNKAIVLSLAFMFLFSFALRDTAYADQGAGGYKIVYENTNFLGVVKVQVSNPHTNYMGPTHGTREHVNVNVYVSGVNVANFHVWRDGNCIVVFESKSNNTTRYCGSDTKTAIKKAFEKQISTDLADDINSHIPWYSVATAAGVIVFAGACLILAPEALPFLALA